MHKLLIVDDEEINRLALEAGFSDLYEIVHAKNGRQALDWLYYDETIAAVLLDINMPGMNGFDVLKELNETGLIKRIPVYIITSSNEDDELLKAYEYGAVDVVSKPYNINFLRRRVTNTVELYHQRDNLAKVVEQKTSELIRQNKRLVEAMADIVEFRSNESGTHVKRVSGYTKILMEGLVEKFPEYKYLSRDIDNISFAACLHDLGKIAVSDIILNKPGRLTAEEFEVMKAHTMHGYNQILALKDIMSPELYKYCLDIIRHHHERYDGRGYPDKLKGDEISVWSQAVAIADCYDALSSKRCYKDAFSHEVSCEMIINGDCGQFNPKMLAVFEEYKDKIQKFKDEILRKRILIIDDSEIDRSVLNSMLLNHYDIMDIESGTLAFNHLVTEANKYDAIIVDVNMPKMSGFELIERLGKEFAEKNTIIMCSVDVNKDNVIKAAELGVRTFMRKPFEYEAVIRKIRNVIGD